MLTILLIQPGATDFDEQGRIKGTLDFPLSDNGVRQASEIRDALADTQFDALYAGPCRSAQETAEILAEPSGLRVRKLEGLRNIDHGLWQGKLIEEIKRNQPKAFRQGQEHAEDVCPPEGEPIQEARERVRQSLQKLMRRHKRGTIGLIVSEPLASLMAAELEGRELQDLWKSECDEGKFRVLRVGAPEAPRPILGFLGNAG